MPDTPTTADLAAGGAARDGASDTSTGREPTSDSGAGHRSGRLLVLGANGPTGRLVVRQALDRGHRVAALTRHPDAFPVHHDRLDVVAGDATDADVVDAAVAGSSAVVCAIGTAFTRQPVDVYSASARLVVEAMPHHGVRRLLVLTSGGVAPTEQSSLVGRVSRSLMRDHIGRTVYDDMQRMEAVVSATDLDWTIVRPPGLTNQPGSGYAVAEDRIDGRLGAREDLAALLLDQLDDERFVRRIAAMCTPGLRVSPWRMFREEVLKR